MVKRGIILSVKVRAGAKLPKLDFAVFFVGVLDSQVIPESHLCGGIGDSSYGLSLRTTICSSRAPNTQ